MPRAGSEEPEVVGDLHDGAGDDVERPGDLDHGVVGRQRLELVGRRDEGEAGDVGHLRGDLLREPDTGVESGPHGRSAGGQHVESGQGGLHPLDSCG